MEPDNKLPSNHFSAPDPAFQFAYPVAAQEDLPPGGAPINAQLLGHHWVLWRDAEGQAVAALDRCPHRGAALSLGKVEAGQLVCPYHGWHFGSDGRCLWVPALPGWVPPEGHRLHTLKLLPAYGLLWLRPDGIAAAAPPFSAEADARLRKLNVGPYEVATSAGRIVENFLDIAHFSFVHAGWLGDAHHAEVLAHDIEVGPAGIWAKSCKAWQPQSNRLSTEGSWVDYDYRVPAPFVAVLEKAPQAQDGYRESIALFIQPLSPESCRVWFRMAVPDWQSSDEQLRAFQDTIFSQDAPVLLSQTPKRLPLTDAAPVQEVHCAADRSSAAYRRYLRQLGWRYGVD